MNEQHIFMGKWITTDEFYALPPRNVFHRQFEKLSLDCSEHRNRHILYRGKFFLKEICRSEIFISADDYYKLYINGEFVAQGPAPSYHFCYNYNTLDVSKYLHEGENTIAVHTLYQGLINRVWQSGDNRHGLIFDLVAGGRLVACSDENIKVAPHTGYRETGTWGYDTQFAEEYDSRAHEVGFFAPEYDDGAWGHARLSQFDDHALVPQESHGLIFEKIVPKDARLDEGVAYFDFGKIYVGYLCATVKGRNGEIVTVRCAQEKTPDGSIRYKLRCNCSYEEDWILSGGNDTLDWFDFKSFRYATLALPQGATVADVYLLARHYPFSLVARPRPEYKDNEDLMRIWRLCTNSIEYGVQETIQDCMDREKGFYMGDGCYSALTHMILSGDDSMVRKLINDGFSTSFITEGLVTCMDCSFIQEIAEFPLMLIYLVLWHYNLTKDREYLAENYPRALSVVEYYRKNYENDGLVFNLDKWCVVEWPQNCRDGYDVDIRDGQVCRTPHISINAYYIEAVKCLNKMAYSLGMGIYRDISPLTDAFVAAFYDKERKLFCDSSETDHISVVGNTFPYAFGLCPDKECEQNIANMIEQKRISSANIFCPVLMLRGMARTGNRDLLTKCLLDPDAWLKMLSEGATTTFESFSSDKKWNTSLFHLTLTYAALFLADVDINEIFDSDIK